MLCAKTEGYSECEARRGGSLQIGPTFIAVSA